MNYLKPFREIPYGEHNRYCQRNMNQWDGSDIFWVKPNCLIMTERLRKLLYQKKTNIRVLFRMELYGDNNLIEQYFPLSAQNYYIFTQTSVQLTTLQTQGL